MIMNNKQHDRLVNEFFAQEALRDPQQYRDICQRYPVLSAKQWRRIRENEETRGLIGLQPSRESHDRQMEE